VPRRPNARRYQRSTAGFIRARRDERDQRWIYYAIDQDILRNVRQEIGALFGTGSVACAVLTGALQGLWQVAVVWGFGFTIAIYCSAALSGAHLNPPVSLMFALLRPASFPRARLIPYCLAQVVGAIHARRDRTDEGDRERSRQAGGLSHSARRHSAAHREGSPGGYPGSLRS
jgi:hypothetical protein